MKIILSDVQSVFFPVAIGLSAAAITIYVPPIGAFFAAIGICAVIHAIKVPSDE